MESYKTNAMRTIFEKVAKERNVKLSEVIKELQTALDVCGDCDVLSVGTSSGENISFNFYMKNDKRPRTAAVRCFR